MKCYIVPEGIMMMIKELLDNAQENEYNQADENESGPNTRYADGITLLSATETRDF
jgi:hypothetical protein